ncbi:MAG: alpha-1,2-fucosyltransferase [Flavobacteriia bacterium]|nr:alpha-1,2-fucosyltransferase [Flavobacteriia bacterium]
MSWVAPHLTGGLGNRLFQYAAAAGLAEKWNRQVVFFLPRCNETGHGPFENTFKLLPLVPVLASEAEWETLLEPQSCMYRFCPFPDTPIEKNAVIQGYRQTESYFPSGGVRLDFKTALGEQRFQELKLKEPTNTWFLHVRLGDYKILPHHQVDLRKYYVKCLVHVPKDAKLLFFSDEPKLCAEAFRGICSQLGLQFEVVEREDELECLYLMSQCKGGAITANSTFSWWGAYLAHQDSPLTFRAFYPTQWGQRMPPPVHIIPSWGTAIDVEE